MCMSRETSPVNRILSEGEHAKMEERRMSSVSEARHNALEGIQSLLALADDVPSAQLRLMMQAACLDIASSIEELSSVSSQKIAEAHSSLGSSREVA